MGHRVAGERRQERGALAAEPCPGELGGLVGGHAVGRGEVGGREAQPGPVREQVAAIEPQRGPVHRQAPACAELLGHHLVVVAVEAVPRVDQDQLVAGEHRLGPVVPDPDRSVGHRADQSHPVEVEGGEELAQSRAVLAGDQDLDRHLPVHRADQLQGHLGLAPPVGPRHDQGVHGLEVGGSPDRVGRGRARLETVVALESTQAFPGGGLDLLGAELIAQGGGVGQGAEEQEGEGSEAGQGGARFHGGPGAMDPTRCRCMGRAGWGACDRPGLRVPAAPPPQVARGGMPLRGVVPRPPVGGGRSRLAWILLSEILGPAALASRRW